ncbi:glycosyltransferase family 4 protein [Brachybacterium timonense]|uniref:glycosyltransferase family 4 protein n=1 Tax=Brachybacterium timonense TaxID=2050896 RepID=UPI000D0B88B0|nr:glycosyltransferase family 1 protein [Brachybacterium timonense]
MDVLVDGAFASYECGGIGAYSVEVILGLGQAGFTVDVVAPGPRPDITNRANVNVHIEPFPFFTAESLDSRSVWHQSVMQRHAVSLDPDVYLGPAFMAPIEWRGPKVVTVHDLAFEHSGLNPPENEAYYSFWARRCARDATQILCPSGFTKWEIGNLWGVPEAAISVTHLAPSLPLGDVDVPYSRNVVAELLGWSHPFVLHVGGLTRRKNIETVLRAMVLVCEQVEELGLVIVGQDDPTLRKIAEGTPLEERLQFTGYCARDLMPAVYSAAECLVYPSLLEGFGLPPVEAMSVGTPVIVSDIPVFREILEDGALFCDPQSPHDLARKVLSISGDSTGAVKGRVERGREIVAKYSWYDVGMRTANALEAAASGRGI